MLGSSPKGLWDGVSPSVLGVAEMRKRFPGVTEEAKGRTRKRYYLKTRLKF